MWCVTSPSRKNSTPLFRAIRRPASSPKFSPISPTCPNLLAKSALTPTDGNWWPLLSTGWGSSTNPRRISKKFLYPSGTCLGLYIHRSLKNSPFRLTWPLSISTFATMTFWGPSFKYWWNLRLIWHLYASPRPSSRIWRGVNTSKLSILASSGPLLPLLQISTLPPRSGCWRRWRIPLPSWNFDIPVVKLARHR